MVDEASRRTAARRRDCDCSLGAADVARAAATVQDVVQPSLRGTAMALYFFAMYVLGASFGPLATGMASDFFTRRAAGDATALEPFRGAGLHSAMYLVPVLSVVLALVLFAATRTVGKVMERVN
jgi:MFS family permease